MPIHHVTLLCHFHPLHNLLRYLGSLGFLFLLQHPAFYDRTKRNFSRHFGKYFRYMVCIFLVFKLSANKRRQPKPCFQKLPWCYFGRSCTFLTSKYCYTLFFNKWLYFLYIFCSHFICDFTSFCVIKYKHNVSKYYMKFALIIIIMNLVTSAIQFAGKINTTNTNME